MYRDSCNGLVVYTLPWSAYEQGRGNLSSILISSWT